LICDLLKSIKHWSRFDTDFSTANVVLCSVL